MNPYNLSKQWENLRLRVSTISRNRLAKSDSNYAIVYMSMLFDLENNLVGYAEPVCRLLVEPSIIGAQGGSDLSSEFEWKNLKKCVSNLARRKLVNNDSRGCVVVHVSIFMNSRGQVVGYTEPACKRLEPSNMDWMAFLFGADS